RLTRAPHTLAYTSSLTIHTTSSLSLFSFNATAPTATYPLSLHDALPIYRAAFLARPPCRATSCTPRSARVLARDPQAPAATTRRDRKSTRLNSSHLGISYAVFCLKKKKNIY